MITYYLVMDSRNRLVSSLTDEATAKACARHHNGYVVYINRVNRRAA